MIDFLKHIQILLCKHRQKIVNKPCVKGTRRRTDSYYTFYIKKYNCGIFPCDNVHIYALSVDTGITSAENHTFTDFIYYVLVSPEVVTGKQKLTVQHYPKVIRIVAYSENRLTIPEFSCFGRKAFCHFGNFLLIYSLK